MLLLLMGGILLGFIGHNHVGVIRERASLAIAGGIRFLENCSRIPISYNSW